MPAAEQAEQAEEDDRQHGNRDRRADRQPGLQPQVGVGHAEQHAQEDAGDDRLDRELGGCLAVRVGLERLALTELVRGAGKLLICHEEPRRGSERLTLARSPEGS